MTDPHFEDAPSMEDTEEIKIVGGELDGDLMLISVGLERAALIIHGQPEVFRRMTLSPSLDIMIPVQWADEEALRHLVYHHRRSPMKAKAFPVQ